MHDKYDMPPELLEAMQRRLNKRQILLVITQVPLRIALVLQALKVGPVAFGALELNERSFAHGLVETPEGVNAESAGFLREVYTEFVFPLARHMINRLRESAPNSSDELDMAEAMACRLFTPQAVKIPPEILEIIQSVFGKDVKIIAAGTPPETEQPTATARDMVNSLINKLRGKT